MTSFYSFLRRKQSVLGRFTLGSSAWAN